jgi:hypothetical protein
VLHTSSRQESREDGISFIVLTADATLSEQVNPWHLAMPTLKQEYQIVEYRLNFPFKMILSAPPGAGKTERVLSIIKNRFHIFPVPISKVINFFGIYRKNFDDIKKEMPEVNFTSPINEISTEKGESAVLIFGDMII